MAADNVVFGSGLVPQFTTGDWTTVNDPYYASLPTANPDPFNKNGARNVLGAAFLVQDSSGRLKKIRYVRYNSTANPAAPAAPGPVYWADNTRTVVTGKFSESSPASISNMVAGYLVNLNFTNGNYIFIQTFGYLAQALAGTAAAGAGITATGDFAVTALANATTAPTVVVLAYALAVAAGGKADVNVCIDTL